MLRILVPPLICVSMSSSTSLIGAHIFSRNTNLILLKLMGDNLFLIDWGISFIFAVFATISRAGRVCISVSHIVGIADLFEEI